MSDGGPNPLEKRVLLLAPTAKDAAAAVEIFSSAGIRCDPCKNLDAVCSEIERGAGAAIVPDEAVFNDRGGCLARVLNAQPPWSDFPLVVLTSPRADSQKEAKTLDSIGHMTLVPRPVEIRALASTVRNALRDRGRQYALRDYLVEHEKQAEALRQSEERFRTLAESIPQLAWMARPDGHIFWYNKRWYDYTGTTPSGVEGWGWQSVHDPEVLPDVLERWRGSIASGEPFEMVFPLRGADGRFRSFLTRVVPFHDAQGRTHLWFGTNTDIEDREQAERLVRESKDRLTFALAAGSLGSWDLDLATGEVDCTPLCKRNFGLHADAQLTPSSLFDSIHPEDRPAVEEALGRAVDGRSDYDVEYRTRWPDGSIHWVMVRGRAVRDARGVPSRVTGITLDVTERKHAEEAARKRAAQVQRLAEVSTRLSAARDVDSLLGVITDESRALIGAHRAVTSMSGGKQRPEAASRVSLSEEQEKCRGSEFVPDGPRLDPFIRAMSRPVRMTREEIDKHPAWKGFGRGEGECLPARGWLAAPLVGRDGRGLGLLQLSDKVDGEFTDSDEAVLVQLAHMASVAIENARLYDELRQNDRRKDEFLAMLAHELRNPLAAVNNAVTVLKVSADEESRHWAGDVIERQVRQLVRLIDDLLDVSRITSGKIRLRKETLDAGAVLDEAIESARPLIVERKHELVVSCERGRLPVYADPTRLEQIVLNLLTNAAKYTGSGGRIWLTAGREGDQVVIKVRDNGMGIPPEKLPEMFTLFAQGERSIARSEGGLGIGLTIVRQLAEMHGGGVTAKSEGPGRGSEFIVSLPAATGPATARAASEAPRVVKRGARILVVDDNVDTARGMGRLLELLGNEVTVSHDGNSALEAAHVLQPEFVLLDIGLPGMNGYQVAARLREDERCKDAVIIAVSGYGQDEDRRRSRAAGFDHHLVKPVDFDSLVSLIGQTD